MRIQPHPLQSGPKRDMMSAMFFGKHIAIFASLLLAAVFTGCSDKPAPAPAAPAAPAATNTATIKKFNTRGVIEVVHATNSTLEVKHEVIPDYMEAMTMTFDVRPTNGMAGLKRGDIISFVLVDAGKDGWIENLKVVGFTNLPNVQMASPVKFIKSLEVGDAMQNFTFTNELNQAISVEGFKGTAFAITFIFTRCPFPTFCPRMNENFANAYAKLSKMASGPRNWRLISLSFDPEFDTPATLKNYAGRYQYNPERWSFATGSLQDVGTLGDQIGLIMNRENNTINHNLRTIIVDTRGRLHKVYVGNEWKVDDFVDEMLKAANAK